MFEKIAHFMGINKNTDENFIRRSILVVDDNEMDLLIVRKTIEKMGHRVFTAENGQIGFQIAKSDTPDLILSDCNMPETSGVDMCKLLKADDDTKNIPFVFLTCVDTPANVIECFDLGAQNYICKPIKPKILTSQIQTIFDECLTT